MLVPAGSTRQLTVEDSDNNFEYRHVILPKQMLKLIPKQCVLSAPNPSSFLSAPGKDGVQRRRKICLLHTDKGHTGVQSTWRS
jgi:hypothetical protein